MNVSKEQNMAMELIRLKIQYGELCDPWDIYKELSDLCATPDIYAMSNVMAPDIFMIPVAYWTKQVSLGNNYLYSFGELIRFNPSIDQIQFDLDVKGAVALVHLKGGSCRERCESLRYHLHPKYGDLLNILVYYDSKTINGTPFRSVATHNVRETLDKFNYLIFYV